MKTPILGALGALALALAPSSPDAQCALPDGLNGPCCEQAQANLPLFPDLELPGMGICWKECDPVAEPCMDVRLGQPVQTSCAQYVADLVATDCATGVPALSGKVTLDYTRNWDELAPVSPVDTQYGVWRFAAKADLSGVAGVAPTCPAPSCLGTHPTAFYYGYVDYALNCATGEWEGALVLYHACDKFIHDPLFSDKPGSFHPGESYGLVAPATSANPFVPSVAPAPGGAIVAEATRRAADPTTLTCFTEEPVNGELMPLGMACACPFGSGAPPQLTARHLEGFGACGSSFTSVNTFPTFPWLETMTTSIGRWTTGASYPGPEHAWVDESAVLYTDACASTVGGSVFAEIHYGASTAEGYEVVPTPVGFVTQNFLDTASNYSADVAGGITFPLVGSVRSTRHLIYVNTP